MIKKIQKNLLKISIHKKFKIKNDFHQKIAYKKKFVNKWKIYAITIILINIKKTNTKNVKNFFTKNGNQNTLWMTFKYSFSKQTANKKLWNIMNERPPFTHTDMHFYGILRICHRWMNIFLCVFDCGMKCKSKFFVQGSK